MDRIEKGILSLDEMPERFRVFEKEPWYNRGLRQMPVDNFFVFYIPNAEEETKRGYIMLILKVDNRKDHGIPLR